LTASEQKRVLLNNLMQEMQFKVHLRRTSHEKTVEDLLEEQMTAMKQMFKRMDNKMNAMDKKIDTLQAN